MNISKREFLKKFSTNTLKSGAAVFTPLSIYTIDRKNDLSELSAGLENKILETKEFFQKKVYVLSERIDTLTIDAVHQRAQLHLIFLLLTLSFAIDGGIVFFWLFL